MSDAVQGIPGGPGAGAAQGTRSGAGRIWSPFGGGGTALPRPGTVLGAYPQREDERLGMLDRWLAQAVGWGRKQLVGLGGGNAAFLRRVRRAEQGLDTLSDLDLRARVDDLRDRLRIKGLTDPLMAEAFALIRETSARVLEMRPYDVQLIGARVMLSGRIAEMDTGEGKTLTATLPAATAALAGTPVHIVTVNDFLVERDAAWMAPLFRALGLSVGVILEGMGMQERKAAYAHDITYCTNKQLAFDYLKDRILLDQETRPLHLKLEGLTAETPRTDHVLMRGLCFAIVDEADSCLVDEARTPLIISKMGENSDMEETYRRAIQLGRQLEQPRDFTMNIRDRRVIFTDLGKHAIRRISETWGGVWAAEVHREELARQSISALHLYERDKHYIVREGGIQIVDEYTGRVMADRSWERGLHQMIEVKEDVEVTGRNETMARISYQRFFGRYLKLAGMTGTGRELAGELWSVYGLAVSRVPPNKRSQRRRLAWRYYMTEDQKWDAVAARIEELHATGQPVLVGTRSVAASEVLSARLADRALPHQVLNARQDGEEADIVAEAGTIGQITVATNMAGRGTDIKLAPGVESKGGLFVLGTELHDSARIDRQLFGRAARQGEQGACQMFLSAEDEIIRDAFGTRLNRFLTFFTAGGRIWRPVAYAVFWAAQNAAERRNAVTRRSLLRYDDTQEDLLAFTGRTE